MIVEAMSPGPLDSLPVSGKEAAAAIPIFYSETGSATALLLRVRSDDNKVRRTYRVEVSGKTGRLSLQDCSTTIKPLFDSAPEETAEAKEKPA